MRIVVFDPVGNGEADLADQAGAGVDVGELGAEDSEAQGQGVGYSVVVRARDNGPSRFAVSVPVTVPGDEVRLGYASRGSRVQLLRAE